MTAAPERELALSNSMCQLNSGERDGCSSKRLEAHHGSAAAFDRTMILLNDVV
jgi:hypothetical protein